MTIARRPPPPRRPAPTPKLRLRGPWSWPAVLALLALLAMPFTGLAGASSVGAWDILICTPDGPRHVTLGDDGTPTPPPAAATAKACWFCLAHPGWLPPVPPRLSLPCAPAIACAPAPTLAGIAPRLHFLAGHGARAPPPGRV